MAESAGSVNVTANIVNGTLARHLRVLLMTALADGTATGIYKVPKSFCEMCDVHGKPFLVHSATVDFEVTSSDLTFDTATSSQIVTIPILEDDIVEDSETIIVTLTSADPAAIIKPSSASITIEDNDGK